jgi:cobalt-zinc-cadmium resistance protein CzcA
LLPALAQAQSAELDLNGILEIAYQNNGELEAYRLNAEAEQALIKTAFSIDKTNIYYNYDENNVAANDYPIGVIGGEQRFEFPTVYFAQKRANAISYDMTVNQYFGKKRQLTRDVSKAYNQLLYTQQRHKLYQQVDSLYRHIFRAAQSNYEKGAISYLELLNAQSKYNEVSVMQSQMKQDVGIAYDYLSTLMQYDSMFVVVENELSILQVYEDSIGSDPGFQYLQNANLKFDAELRVIKNTLLPDVTLSYFNGTNKYENAARYQGFEIGMGIPLFFSDQRARIKAKQFSMEANANLQEAYTLKYENLRAELKGELKKYQASIKNYTSTGKELSAELVRSSELSYAAGEIDFFRFAQSMDRAMEIELDYLNNLYQHNMLVLDINYLIIEN